MSVRGGKADVTRADGYKVPIVGRARWFVFTVLIALGSLFNFKRSSTALQPCK